MLAFSNLDSVKKVFFIGLLLLAGNVCSYGQRVVAHECADGKWGFKDRKKGTVVISCKYDYANEFKGGFAIVKRNGKWTYIDKAGRESVSPKSCHYIYDVIAVSSLRRKLETARFIAKLERRENEKNEVFHSEREERIIEVNNPASENTSDIIIFKNGQEIKTKITEITTAEIKYKAFEHLDGPARSVQKSDVVVILYGNGTRELISTASSKRNSNTNCTKKSAFGMDIGFGGSFLKGGDMKGLTYFAPALGIRVMHHFNPYFGVDFLKINWITDALVSESSGIENTWTMRLQLMPGIRGNTPTFFKCMSAYAAFRLGYGLDIKQKYYKSLCLEAEIGLNLSPTVFVGFMYNCQEYFNLFGMLFERHTFSFRLGFNFGK